MTNEFRKQISNLDLSEISDVLLDKANEMEEKMNNLNDKMLDLNETCLDRAKTINLLKEKTSKFLNSLENGHKIDVEYNRIELNHLLQDCCYLSEQNALEGE